MTIYQILEGIEGKQLIEPQRTGNLVSIMTMLTDKRWYARTALSDLRVNLTLEQYVKFDLNWRD